MNPYRGSPVTGAQAAWENARREVAAALAARPKDPARVARARTALQAATRNLRAAVAQARQAGVPPAQALPCEELLRAVKSAGRTVIDARGVPGMPLGPALREYRKAHAAARACLGPDAARSRWPGELEAETGGWHRHGRTLVVDDPYAPGEPDEPDEEIFRWLAKKAEDWLARRGAGGSGAPPSSGGGPGAPGARDSLAPVVTSVPVFGLVPLPDLPGRPANDNAVQREFSPGALFARAEQNALRLPPERRAAYLTGWADRLTRLARARGVPWQATTSRNPDGSTLIVGGRADQARVVAPDGVVWRADASDFTQVPPFGTPSYRAPMAPVEPGPRRRR